MIINIYKYLFFKFTKQYYPTTLRAVAFRYFMSDKFQPHLIIPIVSNPSLITNDYILTSCISDKKMVIGKFFKALDL